MHFKTPPQKKTRKKRKKRGEGFDDGHIVWVHILILKPLSLACCDIKKSGREGSRVVLYFTKLPQLGVVSHLVTAH
jgi:hypothetical protein